MDVPVSPQLKRRRRRRRWALATGGIILLLLITVSLSHLQPADPSVEKSALFLDIVKRGELILQVRGSGTLVPEEIRWIPTVNDGVVERILVLPGAAVTAGTVLVELSNPELEQGAFEAESELKGARADLTNLQVQLASQKLTQQATVAAAQADYTTAKTDSDANAELGRLGLVPAISVRQANTKTEELAKLLKIEQDRLAISSPAAQAQLAAQDEKIAQLSGMLDLKRRQLEGLRISAGMEGVLQRLGDPTTPLQVGQRLSAGALVALVASQTKLKAAIQVAETQAKDIRLGQTVVIDTRNGLISGRVTRIDPAVQNGTVTVDVALAGPLPEGARPDMSVDGAIQLDHLADVLNVGRPAQGQANSQVALFKMVDNGRAAVRVSVRLGRSSVGAIEIVQGLQAGDQVIISDMSQWDAYDRIRIN